jgi:hypothetical protein
LRSLGRITEGFLLARLVFPFGGTRRDQSSRREGRDKSNEVVEERLMDDLYAKDCSKGGFVIEIIDVREVVTKRQRSPATDAIPPFESSGPYFAALEARGHRKMVQVTLI